MPDTPAKTNRFKAYGFSKHLVLFFFLLLFFGFPESASACTSFAVFSNEVYYAMNFDFLNPAMKLLITANGDVRTFHLAFERCMNDFRFFVNTVGMNNKGLFASCQELSPANENPREKTDNNLFIFELYEAMAHCRSVDEIVKISKERPLVDMPGITLHNLFADINGRAVVTEAGEKATLMTGNNESYLVMTNFSNASLAGKSYIDAEGKGADRYKICHEYLSRHASDFTIDHGLKLLSMTVNRDPQYPTACSMVFDPQNSEVYIVLQGAFSKILKLSIENCTIETWKGFKKKRQLVIPPGREGLLVEDLVRQMD